MGGSKKNERNNGDERKMGGSKGTKETMGIKRKMGGSKRNGKNNRRIKKERKKQCRINNKFTLIDNAKCM